MITTMTNAVVAVAMTTTIMFMMNTSIITNTTTMITMMTNAVVAAVMNIITSMKNISTIIMQPVRKNRFSFWKIWAVPTVLPRWNAALMN